MQHITIRSVEKLQALLNEEQLITHIVLDGGVYENLDLSGYRFQHVVFQRVTFIRCLFAETTWSECSWQQVHLDHCVFHNSHFIQSQFEYVNAVGLDATASQFEQSHFSHVVWGKDALLQKTKWSASAFHTVEFPAMFTRLMMVECYFEHLKLPQNSQWLQVYWEHCSAKQAVFQGATLEQVNLHECDFEEADFSYVTAPILGASNSNFARSQFVGAMLSGAMLDHTKCNQANFTEANLANSQLKKSLFHQAVFAKTMLDYADFSHSELNGVNFSLASLKMANFHAACLMGAVMPQEIPISWRGGDRELRQAEQWQPDPKWLGLIEQKGES